MHLSFTMSLNVIMYNVFLQLITLNVTVTSSKTYKLLWSPYVADIFDFVKIYGFFSVFLLCIVMLLVRL